MISNIQPVNKRRNNVRFKGNPQQSQPDSVTLSSSSVAKPQETNVNDIIKEVDEVLKNPDSTYEDKKQAMNRLKETGVNLAKEGNSEVVKPFTAKLMSLLDNSKFNYSVNHSATTTLVEMAANDDMKSLNEVLQSTEKITPEQLDHLEVIAKTALELYKPKVAQEIIKILNENFKNSDNPEIRKKCIKALIEIGDFPISRNGKITQEIARTLGEDLQSSDNLEIKKECVDALNKIKFRLGNFNPQVEATVFRALGIKLRGSDDPDIEKACIEVLKDINISRWLKDSKIAILIAQTFTEIIRNPDKSYLHEACAEDIGKIFSNISNSDPKITLSPKSIFIILKTLIERFNNPDNPDIKKACLKALNNIVYHLEDKSEEMAEETVKALEKIIQNTDNPDLQRIYTRALGKMGNKFLEEVVNRDNIEKAEKIVETLIEKFYKSGDIEKPYRYGDTDIHGIIAQSLIDIGNKDFTNYHLKPRSVIVNIDDCKITRLIISKLGKSATSPEFTQEEEASKLSKTKEILLKLKEEPKKYEQQDIIAYIESWEKAIEDLGPYNEKVREFDKAFKQDNLDELVENLKRKELDELYYDLRSTGEAFKKMYDARPKTLPEDVDQRYKKFMEYFENKAIKKIIKCIKPLRDLDRIPDDIIRIILKKTFSPPIVNAAL